MTLLLSCICADDGRYRKPVNNGIEHCQSRHEFAGREHKGVRKANSRRPKVVFHGSVRLRTVLDAFARLFRVSPFVCVCCEGASTAALEELQDISIKRMQSCWRMYSAHKKLRLAIEARFEKYFDPKTGAFYYVDKVMRKTVWHKPALLGHRDLENSPEVQRHVDAYREKVASKLQAVYRRRKAWATIVKPMLLKKSIRKYWDPNTKTYYYASTRTGRVSATVSRRHRIVVTGHAHARPPFINIDVPCMFRLPSNSRKRTSSSVKRPRST